MEDAHPPHRCRSKEMVKGSLRSRLLTITSGLLHLKVHAISVLLVLKSAVHSEKPWVFLL